MYSCAEMTFKQILDTGYANHFHSSWFTYSQNARLYNKLNDWILYFIFFLILFTNLELSLPASISVGLGILNFILIIFYILNPSKRLSEYFTKKNIDKFNKQLENRIDSIEYFTQKINQNPNDYVALLERGIFYNLKDDYDNSLTDLNNVLKINSNNSAAFYYRAIALTKLDRHKEAIEDLSKLIKLNESDKAELYNNRGSLYLLLNNNNLALEDYCKAIELEPYYASYRFDRAYLYQENGNNTEAIADYDVVIALEPENYIAITNRGEAYYALGDKKKAFIDFKRAKDFGYLEAVENLNKFDFE
jgi:tetratricopeptide (TPR) repeat protein